MPWQSEEGREANVIEACLVAGAILFGGAIIAIGLVFVVNVIAALFY